jgi:alcohol dehydrogenase class IV
VSSFSFTLPTHVVFGAGAVESVGVEAARCGNHALLVTGSTFARRSGLIDHLLSLLRAAGVEVSLYDSLPQNPSVEAIDAGGQRAREAGADLVVGLGGGSALDAAKAVAAAACASGTLWSYVRSSTDARPLPIERALPLIQVPIIASTGSEVNGTAVIYDERSAVKAPLSSPHLHARVAIVDPALTFSVPARYTTVGAMNIVTQMLESYLTSDEFAVTDRVTEGLMRVVIDSLARATRQSDDLDARSNLSWAATLASSVAQAGRSGAMPIRSLAYPVTARYRVDHGAVLAGLWPSFMRYALSNRLRLPQVGRFKRFALLGRQLFGVHETDDEVAAEMTAYRFEHWLRSAGMATDLSGLDLAEDDISALASQAVTVSGNGKRLSSGLSLEDIEHIYDGALRPSSLIPAAPESASAAIYRRRV